MSEPFTQPYPLYFHSAVVKYEIVLSPYELELPLFKTYEPTRPNIRVFGLAKGQDIYIYINYKQLYIFKFISLQKKK